MHRTFHEAALAAGYLENEREWEECLTETAHERMPYQLRQLFAIILVYSLPSSPIGLWERFKHELSEDFQINLGADMDDQRLEYRTLQSVDKILRTNGKTLVNYALPLLEYYDQDAADGHLGGDLVCRELYAYPLEQLESTTAVVDKLNENQRDVFDQVMGAVQSPQVDRKLFFYGSGGTGKSFLLEQILARSQKAELIRRASLIIWDETPMMHRACFEAVDRTFHDITNNEVEPFGGGMVFSCDHRPILPVLKDATRAETLQVCFKAYLLWQHLRQVRLIENMRVKTALDPDDAAELAEFLEFLLQIGEGRYPVNRDIDDNDSCIPQSMCVTPVSGGSSTSIQESSDGDSEYEAPNFNLLPQLDPQSERESDEPEDDRRTRSISTDRCDLPWDG